MFVQRFATPFQSQLLLQN